MAVDHATEAAVPIPAATLIVLREGAAGLEVLMVRRTAAMAFAPGAWVFPGGRVDAADAALAGDGALDGEAAARVAAVRETVEETGLALAIEELGARAVEQLRAALGSGAGFAEALAGLGGSLMTDRLVPFALWTPRHRTHRNFDTRFFLVDGTEAIGQLAGDDAEVHDVRWTTPQAMLAAADAGTARVIFPTRRNLERLARFATFAEAVADARAHPVAPIVSRLEQRDGVDWLTIPDGLGYPITAERLDLVTRG